MKKKLLELSTELLTRIGSDYGCRLGSSREEVATFLSEYFRGYGFKWSDVAARYGINLNCEKILKEAGR